MFLSESDKQRFWSKVNIKGVDECWEWIASKCSSGYGNFRLQGKIEGSHRISYFLEHRQFDKSLCVLHKCDNPSCVNPKHLFLGTNKENHNDMAKKDRGTKFSDKSDILLAAELYYDDELTLQEIADNLGCDNSTIGRWLNFNYRTSALTEKEIDYIERLKCRFEVRKKAKIRKVFELKYQGLPQHEIANRLNITQSDVYNWLNCKVLKNITIPLRKEFNL